MLKWQSHVEDKWTKGTLWKVGRYFYSHHISILYIYMYIIILLLWGLYCSVCTWWWHHHVLIAKHLLYLYSDFSNQDLAFDVVLQYWSWTSKLCLVAAPDQQQKIIPGLVREPLATLGQFEIFLIQHTQETKEISLSAFCSLLWKPHIAHVL